jgi:hypothetical protein
VVTISQKLQEFLVSKKQKTLQELIDDFADKSFAVLFLLLLAIPALPLPTGGITHIFEIIAMLLALELIVGRKTVWLPKRWLSKTLPASLQTSALPRFLKILKWAEKYSRPRLGKVQNSAAYSRVSGAVILLFVVFAFLAPPFSGLDTLPSLGVMLLSLGLIFEDALISVIGVILGSAGILLIFLLGRLAFQLL